MFIALRYLVTVRRATVMPALPSSSTMASSESGFVLSSLSMISCSLMPHAVPGDFLAVGAGGAADEEPLEREDAARRLNPLVVDRPADRRDVDADLVGDLLHLERLDVVRAVVEELRLVIDDRLRHAGERAAALLDRFDQPLGRVDLPLDVLAGLGVRAFVAAAACDSTG